MLQSPQIIRLPARPTAVIHLTIPAREIQQVMGPGIGELMGTISAQGIAPAGPWFTHHLRMPDATFDFEISVPVSAPVTAAGRVRPSEWPAMTAARAVHVGPYEGLGAAWGEFMAWLAANNHSGADDCYESYVAGPDSSPDPAAWRTELIRPLREG